jgi:hypothetical protein
MNSQTFAIGPVKDGLRKDIKPYAIPEDAFETLTNAYQWRGRIVKRSGYTLLARLSTDGGTTFPGLPVMGLRTRTLFEIGQQQLIGFDTVNSYLFSGTVFSTLPSVMPTIWSGTDSQFFWTTNYAGAFWATNGKAGLHAYAISGFAGATATTVDVSTTLPNTLIVGDEVYLLNVTGTAFENNLRFGVVTVAGNPFTMMATDGGPAFVNGVPSSGMVLSSTSSITGQDGIRYYADTSGGATWANYNPPVDPNNALVGALLIFPYRGYLVFLNTIEGNETGTFSYPNRARWTEIGTPYYSPPLPNFPSEQTADPKAARDDLFGRGGANDAPTNDVIVGAEFIRDILVVYFQNSTWRLRFVNNAQNPFVWERVNIELGSSSTFSAVAFDKGLMGIGRRGIIISDGNDTKRFDDKIPDDIFEIRQVNNGLQRVYGIRTFDTRLLYWTFPSNTNPEGTFPDQVLVFNYDTGNWSYFDDCFTCFGYFYPSGAGLTWNDLIEPWASYEGLAWNSGTTQGGYETIVAGNQQGFVLRLEQTDGTNGPSLALTDITGNIITSVDHNLPDGSWITLTDVATATLRDGTPLDGRNFKTSLIDSDTFSISEFAPIPAGDAVGASFDYTIAFLPIIPGSVQINVGALVFTDRDSNGVLFVSGVPSGTIDYQTGELELTFDPPILSTPVNIRVVAIDDEQLIVPASTTGIGVDTGFIAKISNFDIQSKIFNFFNDDKRSRLSKIDFYTNTTKHGQFTCSVFGDSSDIPINKPLPDNLQSNVVITSPNQYQIGTGDQTIFRLYCDATAQTVQLQFTLSDRQMAVNSINSSNLEIVSLMVTLKRGGRLV